MEGRCADRGIVGRGVDPRPTSAATRRARPTNGRWATAFARSTRVRGARSICSRTATAVGGCCGSSRLRRGGSEDNRAGGLRGATWRRSAFPSSRPAARGSRTGVSASHSNCAAWRRMTISAQVEIGRIVGGEPELAAGPELGREQVDRAVIDHPPLGVPRLGPRVGVEQIEEAQAPRRARAGAPRAHRLATSEHWRDACREHARARRRPR